MLRTVSCSIAVVGAVVATGSHYVDINIWFLPAPRSIGPNKMGLLQRAIKASKACSHQELQWTIAGAQEQTCSDPWLGVEHLAMEDFVAFHDQHVNMVYKNFELRRSLKARVPSWRFLSVRGGASAMENWLPLVVGTFYDTCRLPLLCAALPPLPEQAEETETMLEAGLQDTTSLPCNAAVVADLLRSKLRARKSHLRLPRSKPVRRRKFFQEPKMVDQKTVENQYLKLFLIDKGYCSAAGIAKLADGNFFASAPLEAGWNFSYEHDHQEMIMQEDMSRRETLVSEAATLQFVAENLKAPPEGLWLGGQKYIIVKTDDEYKVNDQTLKCIFAAAPKKGVSILVTKTKIICGFHDEEQGQAAGTCLKALTEKALHMAMGF
eukprot:s4710_g3.t1